jgi:hypothetical protein
MQEYEINVTEVSKGILLIEAESLDAALSQADALFYEGAVNWNNTDVSFNS